MTGNGIYDAITQSLDYCLFYQQPFMLQIEEKIRSVLTGGSILIIIPPFSRSTKGAMLEPHTLQALASTGGYRAEILI